MTLEKSEEVYHQVLKNIESISKAIHWYSSEGGGRTLKRVLTLPQRQRLERLTELADKLVSDVLPHTACINGCSHCCYQAVAISTEEAKKITEYTGYSHRKAEMEVTNVNIQRFKGVPCPFLHEGRCGVFEVRPLACRLQFNISDDPSLCDVVSTPGENVPTINFFTYWGTVVASLETSNFNDIRVFFPGTYEFGVTSAMESNHCN